MNNLFVHDNLIGTKATINGVECIVLTVHTRQDDELIVHGMATTGRVEKQLLSRIVIHREADKA